ncbi:unnamed protein product [Dovyalis caffra]|uniref:Uncharacterized protein n=1 Tax=Dovyalis caffra TaxID=77055 RepID=A0AAV1RHH8_9ROSI|nr:unnamed protein product [Dovyalis caffra]
MVVLTFSTLALHGKSMGSKKTLTNEGSKVGGLFPSSSLEGYAAKGRDPKCSINGNNNHGGSKDEDDDFDDEEEEEEVENDESESGENYEDLDEEENDNPQHQNKNGDSW